MTQAKRKDIRKAFARTAAVSAIVGSFMVLIFLVTNMSSDTQKATAQRTELMQNNLIFLADTERKYYKKHGRFAYSIVPLILESSRVNKLTLNHDISISKSAKSVLIEGEIPKNNTTFAIIQGTHKRIKVCEGNTGCEKGRWE